jgi:dienelactone hydrolase
VLTFDAAFQGESEGLPRGREDPAQRIEDIKAAVSFLSTLPGIAAERIGVLGICASGGYAIAAAAGDRRIRAVASVAAVDVGLQMRVGADGQQDPAVLDALLEGAAQARSRAARGEAMGALPVFPANEEEARAGGQHVFEGWDYYCTPRAQHPRSARALSWDSLDRMATFDAFRFIDMIAPRPC